MIQEIYIVFFPLAIPTVSATNNKTLVDARSTFTMPFLHASLVLALSIGLGLMGPSISRTLSISRAIDFSWEPTPAHATSMPMSLLNPKSCKIESNSCSMSISLDKLKPEITDEEILAKFTKGFFGGWVFAFERYACLTLRAVFDFNGIIHLILVWLTVTFIAS